MVEVPARLERATIFADSLRLEYACAVPESGTFSARVPPQIHPPSLRVEPGPVEQVWVTGARASEPSGQRSTSSRRSPQRFRQRFLERLTPSARQTGRLSNPEGVLAWLEARRSRLDAPPPPTPPAQVWIKGAPPNTELRLHFSAGWATWRPEHILRRRTGRWWLETYAQLWFDEGLRLDGAELELSPKAAQGLVLPDRPSRIGQDRDLGPFVRSERENLLALTARRGEADLLSDPRLHGPLLSDTFDGRPVTARFGQIPDPRRALIHRFELRGPPGIRVICGQPWRVWTGHQPAAFPLPRGQLDVQSELHHRHEFLAVWAPDQIRTMLLEPEPHIHVERRAETRIDRGMTEHAITFDIHNTGPQDLEVLLDEPLPSSADPQLKVDVLVVEPPFTDWNDRLEATTSWTVYVPAGRRRMAEIQYRITVPPHHYPVTVPEGLP